MIASGDESRDCAKRGYTTDQVLDDLDRREPDSAAYIRPQRHHADLVVCRQPNADDPFVLDAVLTLRDARLPHPDLDQGVETLIAEARAHHDERTRELLFTIAGAPSTANGDRDLWIDLEANVAQAELDVTHAPQ